MILALLLSAATAAAAANGPEGLGRALAARARAGGARTVSVAEFEAPRSAPSGTGRDAADAVLRGLVLSGRVRAVERGGLATVLSERRLADSGASEDAPAVRLTAGDAVVVGRIEREGSRWVLSARVVAVASGEILGSGRAVVSDFAAGRGPAAESFPDLDSLIDAAHALAATQDLGTLESRAARREAPGAERAEAVLALAEAGGDEDLVLADALRDPEPLVRFAAAMAFGRSASRWAEAPLRESLRKDPSWLARYGAAQALARYRSAPSRRDLAAARTGDPSWRVRRQAADSLAARGEGAL